MLNDFLVIGTGISGLTFAIKVADLYPKLKITIISKGDISDGNTRYAQGGIAVVRNLKDDSIDKHIRDTIVAGDGECDRSVVKFVEEDIRSFLFSTRFLFQNLDRVIFFDNEFPAGGPCVLFTKIST